MVPESLRGIPAKPEPRLHRDSSHSWPSFGQLHADTGAPIYTLTAMNFAM